MDVKQQTSGDGSIVIENETKDSKELNSIDKVKEDGDKVQEGEEVKTEETKKDLEYYQKLFKENDDKEPNEMKIAFSEESIRRAFARKVFILLSLLLLKTVLYSALCIYCKPVRKFWDDNLLHILWGMPVYIISILVIVFCPNLRKRTPWNYILLGLFSTSLTYMIGGLCAVFEEESVMIAFAMTVALVLGLTWFACQTKWDFTGCGMFLFAVGFIVTITTVTSLSYLSIGGRIALSGLAVFIFSIFLIVDIQYIIHGNHRYKISPEEHVLAVAILYLDIVNIFLLILRNMR